MAPPVSLPLTPKWSCISPTAEKPRTCPRGIVVPAAATDSQPVDGEVDRAGRCADGRRGPQHHREGQERPDGGVEAVPERRQPPDDRQRVGPNRDRVSDADRAVAWKTGASRADRIGGAPGGAVPAPIPASEPRADRRGRRPAGDGQRLFQVRQAVVGARVTGTVMDCLRARKPSCRGVRHRRLVIEDYHSAQEVPD